MHLLPAKFVERILAQFPNDADELLASLNTEAKTSVHLHPWRGVCAFEQTNEVPWFSRGRILNERPSFTLDPLFHGGCYYPQESSSMFLHYVLEQIFGDNRSLTCLDLCAAPGGKSILISSFLKNEGRLISNELIRTRNSILRENLTKWGADNVLVTCNDPQDFSALHNYFDCVLTDVPCSGEGMFRKDVSSRNEWSQDNVALCALRQRRILEDITPCIKPGGYLIYSTCTFAPQENEKQIEQLIDSEMFELVNISTPKDWNIHYAEMRSGYGMQFFPHKVAGEGFFIAALRKRSSDQDRFHQRAKPVFSGFSKKEKEHIAEFTDTKQHELLRTTRNEIYASCFSADEMNRLVNELYITMPGIELGEFIKDEFIPAHALALSSFPIHNVQTIEVDMTTALQYLRGEAPIVDGDKGRAIITYQNVPLGWVKIIGNRTNNNYPKEWRIRMR